MGPLDGIRVVEFSHELCAWAAKLMADLGADVIVIEPPGGSVQRTYGPFADDEPGQENSLWWWCYNTSKRSVVLADDDPRVDSLVASADVVIAGRPLERTRWAASNARLVSVSVLGPELLTDLTLLAAGGPVAMCGYDDHSLPPVRGGGNQGYHTASHWAMMSTLVALLEREVSGEGQHIDVSALAACNITTEVGTYGYLAAGVVSERQTGRHASPVPSMATQMECADGRHVNLGLIARRGAEYTTMLAWLDDLGLREEFPLTAFLEMGTGYDVITGAMIAEDPIVMEIAGAAREAQAFVAAKISAYDYFVSSQRRGLTSGVIYAPEEVLTDPHFQARGWPTDVEHPERGRTYVYPGQPYRLTGTPWQIRHRAPLLGEHQSIVG